MAHINTPQDPPLSPQSRRSSVQTASSLTGSTSNDPQSTERGRKASFTGKFKVKFSAPSLKARGKARESDEGSPPAKPEFYNPGGGRRAAPTRPKSSKAEANAEMRAKAALILEQERAVEESKRKHQTRFNRPPPSPTTLQLRRGNHELPSPSGNSGTSWTHMELEQLSDHEAEEDMGPDSRIRPTIDTNFSRRPRHPYAESEAPTLSTSTGREAYIQEWVGDQRWRTGSEDQSTGSPAASSSYLSGDDDASLYQHSQVESSHRPSSYLSSQHSHYSSMAPTQSHDEQSLATPISSPMSAYHLPYASGHTHPYTPHAAPSLLASPHIIPSDHLDHTHPTHPDFVRPISNPPPYDPNGYPLLTDCRCHDCIARFYAHYHEVARTARYVQAGVDPLDPDHAPLTPLAGTLRVNKVPPQ